MITQTILQRLRYDVTLDPSDLPYGFQLRRGPSPNLNDFAGNEPVDPANPTRTVAVDEPLDSRITAIALTETVPPQITGVSPVRIAPVAGNPNRYDITLDITANEPIRSPSSGMFPMSVNSANVATRLNESGFSLISSTNRDSDNSVRYVFRITPPTSPADRRAIKGYTLGTVQGVATRITDLANNVAVRNGGNALYTDDIGGSANNLVTFYQTNAQGAQVSGGNPIDSQIQLRPTVAVLDVIDRSLTEDGNLSYSGVFRVQTDISGLYITNIGEAGYYRLLRIPLVNGVRGTPVPVASNITRVGNVNPRSDQVNFRFDGVTLSAEEARQTAGFTMGINPSSSVRLRDPYGNESLNLITVTSAEINKTSPQISIAASDSNADVDENGRIAIEFTTTADQEVPTLNSAASYQVALVSDNSTSPDTIVLASSANVRSLPASGNSRQATIAYSVDLSNLPLAQLGATKGLTLVRAADNALIDWSANPPANQSGDAIGVGMNGLISEVTNGEIDTLVTINRTPSTMTVTAVSAQAVGSGQIDVGIDENQYTITFDVRSALELGNIGDPSSYVVMRQLISDSTLQIVSESNQVSGQLLSGSVIGSQARLQFIVGLPLDVSRDTAGFTLGRAGPDDDCRLCTRLGDPALRAGGTHGDDVIGINERIDNDPRSFVARDTQPPTLTVALATTAAFVSRIRSDGNGWDINFDVTGADVTDIPRIGTLLQSEGEDESQFRLLGRYNDNTFRVLPTIEAPVYPEVSACQPADPECRLVRASFDLPPSEASQIHSFVLGRAPRGLLDSSDNAPIVANTATDIVVRTDPNDSLPLDWTGTGWVLNRVPPRINVQSLPNFATRIGNRVMGRFELQADGAPPGQNEIINGINDPDSYILLAVSTVSRQIISTVTTQTISEVVLQTMSAGTTQTISTMTTQTISTIITQIISTESTTTVRPLSGATINVEDRGRNNFRTMVRFDVTDPEISDSGHSQWMYTLGLRQNLTDKAGNPPVDAGIATSDVVLDVEDRLDSRDAALFTIPEDDIIPPQLTITATDATGSVNNPLLFTGSFEFTSNEDLADITNLSSYQIVRINNDSSEVLEPPTQTITTSGNNATGPITINFAVTLADIEEVRDTSGFRLITTVANAESLIAISTNDSIVDSLRDTQPPTIMVVAQRIDDEENQPDENNLFVPITGSFNVSAEGGEVIRNINNPDAYRLLRVDDDRSVEDIASQLTVSRLVGSMESGYTLATISFATTLTAGENFLSTKGFTLGNDDSQNVGLQDISGNLAMMVAAQSNRLDADDNAIAERNRPLPEITVIAAAMAEPSDDDPNQYTGSFTVTADRNVATIGTTSSYKLLRITRNDDGTVNPDPVDQTALMISVVSQSSTQVAVNFGVSLSDIEITRATHGFTLGVGSDDALRGEEVFRGRGFAPELGVNGRIDQSSAAVALRDSVAPRLTVVAEGGEPTAEVRDEGASIISYSMRFDVTASEQVKEIGSTASYSLLVLPTGIPTTVTALAVTTGTNVTTATVDVTVSISTSDEQATGGFTLGYNMTSATLSNLNLNDRSGNQPMLDERGRLDRRLAAIAATKPVIIECAAFYPNIGQRQLFFEVLTQFPINEAGLTLMSGTSPQGLLANVEQIGDTTDNGVSILRATLDSEITDSMLSVSYQPENPEVPGAMIMCIADDITDFNDEDGDNLVDIVDSNPFDPNDATLSADTSALGQRVATPSEAENYYNRNVIIRSLLAGDAFEPFTYVNDQGTPERPRRSTFNRRMSMSIASYLGVRMSRNTKSFRVSEGSENSECESILNAAYTYQLGNVKLDEFCSEEIDDETYFATAEVGLARYAWVDINNGRLQLSSGRDEPIILTLRVLPEINFSGQSSYLFTSPTNKSVTVSAYVGMSGGSVDLSVGAYSYDDEDGGHLNRPDDFLELSSQSAGDEGVINTSYGIARRDGHPDVGETVLYWLIGNSSVWSPDNTPLSIQSGGHDLRNTMYAIGGNNHIAVRVADADNSIEQITRISQILLYEHRNSTLTRVSSMVASRTYVVVADIDTNVTTLNAVVAAQMIDGYEIDESMANVVELRQMLGEEDELSDSEDFEFIRLTVNSDITERRLVAVGWDRIANVDDITAGYLVFPTQPAAYEDADGDNVPDMTASDIQIDLYPDDATRLQVNIAETPADAQHARARNGNINGGQLSMFIPYAVLATADDLQEQAGEASPEHYSPTDIDYISIRDGGMWELLDIEANGTFGVQGVEQGFTYDDAGMVTGISGGTVYVTFPIENMSSNLVGETIYIGKYNEEHNEGEGRWESFERMGTTFNTRDIRYMDTWYAIERPSIMEACPQDIERYRNGHTGTDDDGFIASDDNCIMLVITDNHPLHDEDGAPGRVIDPLLFATEPFPAPMVDTPLPPPPPPPPPPASSGGGGSGSLAIGVSDVLILLAALSLLLIANTARRRCQSTTNSPPVEGWQA